MRLIKKIMLKIKIWKTAAKLERMSLHQINLAEAHMRRDGIWSENLQPLFDTLRQHKEVKEQEQELVEK